MSKTLEEIQAEIAATAAGMNAPAPEIQANITAESLGTTTGATGQYQESSEPPPQLTVGELLEQLAAATGVGIDKLLAGLDAAAGHEADPLDLLPPGTKTYYTSTPNSGLYIQVGPAHCERIEFKGDTLHTTDEAVIAALDGIVDKPGSGIFTKSHRHVGVEVEQMRAELTQIARVHHLKMLAAGEKTA